MTLEVDIEKTLPGFTLAVAFAAGDKPVGILGASGAGKSMTLRAIAGLETPGRGRIVLDGRTLFDSAAGIWVPSRARQIGLLFQQYALFPHLTVEENVAFGMRHRDGRERGRRTAEWIAAMRLVGFEARYPAELSGGQMQRAALARALALEPAALLLDEPFSALDTHLRSQLELQLHNTLARYPRPALLVSHNLEELYRLCGEIVVLDRGRVVAQGSREAIFHRPPNRATAVLTGCKNFSRCRPLDAHHVEAVDWGCSLQVAQEIPRTFGHVAIRAHHVQMESLQPVSGSPEENRLPCWLATATEGPFRTTLFLKLMTPAADPSDYHLQVETTRERTADLMGQPCPWGARLDPNRLFLLPD